MSKSGISGKHSSMLLTSSAVGGAMLLGYLIGRSKSEYDVFLDFSQGKIGDNLTCQVTCLQITVLEGFLY